MSMVELELELRKAEVDASGAEIFWLRDRDSLDPAFKLQQSPFKLQVQLNVLSA